MVITSGFQPDEDGSIPFTRSISVKVVETFMAEQVYTVEMQQASWQSILDNFKRYVEHFYFSDKKSGSYPLPLKADVRKKEAIGAGKSIHFTFQFFLTVELRQSKQCHQS